MISVNAIVSVFSDPSSLWTALLLLAALILYVLCVIGKSLAADRRQMISVLPSISADWWSTVRFSLKLGFLNPREIVPFFAEVLKRYGSLVHFQILARHYVLINDPDDIKVLLSSVQHITKGPEYEFMVPWLNEGLITSKIGFILLKSIKTDDDEASYTPGFLTNISVPHPKWSYRRKILTNTFHFKILETYSPSINKHSHLLVKNLIVASENGSKPIDGIESFITKCNLDISGETIMGVNLQTQDGKSAEYVKSIKYVNNILIKRILTFWYWNDLVFYMSKIGRDFSKHLKLVHEYTENVIKKRREILENLEHSEKNEENGKKRVQSFLDLLIRVSKENPGTMTDKDIREEVDTFLFAGHDTSSIALTMAIIHLGLNQNIQNAVRDELYEIFGDSDRDATMEDLKAMPTLDRVIKETMRMYPSVTGISRTLHKPLYLKKYTIPAKSFVVLNFLLLHRAESIYPDPEKFDPDRFTPEQCAERHPYAYIPFSAGPRNCIGQKFAMYQMRIVLSSILRRVTVETLGKQSDIVISTQLTIHADHLPSVRITPIYDTDNQRILSIDP